MKQSAAVAAARRRPPPVQLLPKQADMLPTGAVVQGRLTTAAELMMLRANVTVDEVTRRTGVPTDAVRAFLKRRPGRLPKARLDVLEAIELACGDRLRFGIESLDHPSRAPRSLIEEENQKLVLKNALVEQQAREAIESVEERVAKRGEEAAIVEKELKAKIASAEAKQAEAEAAADKARRARAEVEIENVRLLEEVDRLTKRADLFARNLRALGYNV